MKSIGGYFELAEREAFGGFPVDGVRLNTSRNALEYILRLLPDARHVYLPLYTCESVIEPFNRLSDITYSFYHINDKFEVAERITLEEGEYIIANNYFGLKDAYIAELAREYGERLIVDNAQALFAPAINGVKAIYSARKYVGVADGGFAVGVCDSFTDGLEVEDSLSHCNHLVIRKEQGAEAGFESYRSNEMCLDNQPIRIMSPFTSDILTHIDYPRIISKRRDNFKYVHEFLACRNQLVLDDVDSFVCPMIYPYIGKADVDYRSRLIQNKVYVARYWPNVLKCAESDSLEYCLAEKLVAIPIDHRYNKEDIDRIVNLIFT